MKFDAGSFRDPSGRVLNRGQQVLRVLFAQGLPSFRAAQESGVLAEMVDRGFLLGFRELATDEIDADLRKFAPAGKTWLEHPRIPYLSYPYEWCFAELKAAALLHIDFNLALLEHGYTLSDATAYNIQFQGTRPIFIDHLSVVPYEEGTGWTGQRQFAMQFLCPLFLWARRSIAPHAWYRGAVEGIAPEDAVKFMRFRDRLSFTVLAHIVGPASFARQRVAEGLNSKVRVEPKLSKSRLTAMLMSLRDYIAGLNPPYEKTVWNDYADNNSYDQERRAAKHRFVAEMIASTSAQSVYDFGCNTGDFAQTALDAGARYAIGFDFDLGALEKAYARFSKTGTNILPLWLDAMNPSPSQGWAGSERKSLAERMNADSVLALAFIHHLSIARNVPLDMAVDWLVGLAPTGVIEFPSKADPMVQQLLRHRPDIFPDYTEEAFLQHVGARARITHQERLGDEGRLIIGFDRRT